VTRASSGVTAAWLASAVEWLTPSRLRAQAVVLALCLWGVCAVDFATPGLFDRAGNIKFQDFLPLYASARMSAQGRARELYDQQAVAAVEFRIIGQRSTLRLPNLYGPQVALLFVPLSRFSFQTAAEIWVALSLLIYCACVCVVFKMCPTLAPYSKVVAVAATAFPPLFHFFVRGQVSALVMACFTAALLALRSDRDWLAGIALGLLAFKPQFLIAVPFVFLLARSWMPLAGLAVSVGAQFGFAWACFGSPAMRAYFDTLWHVSRWISTVELSLAPIQMHSLRSFWSLLIAWPDAALILYLVSCMAVVSMAAATWKSSSPLAVRFSALTLAAVLVNPHLFVYDLLVLAPVLLLVVDWTLNNMRRDSSPTLFVLSYLAFILPWLGPLSRWTHIQLSVPVFVALLWRLRRQSAETISPTGAHKLALPDSRVV
jgi:alpha-1,2-mannosyltransferase